MLKRSLRRAARVVRVAAICLFVPVAFFSACDRSDDAASGHAADGHSHSPGETHAAASPATAAAEHYTCPMHPEVQQATPGKCPKCGMDLVQKTAATSGKDEHAADGHDHGAAGHSHGAAEPTMTLAASMTQPLTVGQRIEVKLVLKKKDGSPVTLNDLKEAHTEKIHMLIIDPTLTDYHHEHPAPGSVPGEYRFSFTPQKAGAYRMWADVIPADTGKQEYVIADLGGMPQMGEIPNRASSLTSTVEALTYSVSFDGPLQAGKATLGKLTIKDANGAVFPALEPIMGAYAHIVGFSEDYKTIAHIHPKGEEPTKPSDRGAGELEFHAQPEKAGLMRLFGQVQIGGQSKFAPFTLNVDEAAPRVTKTSGTASALTAEQKQFLAQYEMTRSALAADDLAKAKQAAQTLAQSGNGEAALGTEIASAESIKAAREAFKKLSAGATKIAADQNGYYVMNCPMTANGQWVQTNAEVANPYFGASMLRCGSVMN